MPRFGCFLSSEEHTPAELVRQAQLAEQAGFDAIASMPDAGVVRGSEQEGFFDFHTADVLPRLRGE